MSYEPLIVENWLYDTLSTDQTLAEALATDNRAAFYQIGVYSHVAPLVDPRTGKPPTTPYVILSYVGQRAPADIALCGARVGVEPIYRITVWDSTKGAVSWGKLQTVADRIDALVDNQSLGTTPPAWIRRLDTATEVQVQNDGIVDYGITMTFVAQVGATVTT